MASSINEKTKVSLTMSTLISVIVVVIGLPVYAVGFLDARYGRAETLAKVQEMVDTKASRSSVVKIEEALEAKAERAEVVGKVEFSQLKSQGSYTAQQVKEIRQDVKELLREQRRALRRERDGKQ